MITPASLKSYSHKDLAQMARQGGVRGWHSMKKDELVRALLAISRSAKRIPPKATPSKSVAASRTNGVKSSRPLVHQVPPLTAGRKVEAPQRKPTPPRVLKHLNAVKAKLSRSKNLSSPNSANGAPAKDRIVLMVRDPFWLHVFWEITRSTVERAEVAMGQDWHGAKPVLRLLQVTDVLTMGAAECVLQDVEIHGGLNNWYLHVDDGPKSFRVEIGYLAPDKRFHTLGRSNVVTTPEPCSSDAIDRNWSDVAEDFDRIYAMSGGYSAEGNPSLELQELFEERLRRPMGSPMVTRYGAGGDPLLVDQAQLKFEIDAEMILFGSTHPSARVTLKGEPIRLRPDGTFTVRMAMPNQRQVIPAVACAANGAQQKTVVIAIERNTKEMEPLIREPSE